MAGRIYTISFYITYAFFLFSITEETVDGLNCGLTAQGSPTLCFKSTPLISSIVARSPNIGEHN